MSIEDDLQLSDKEKEKLQNLEEKMEKRMQRFSE